MAKTKQKTVVVRGLTGYLAHYGMSPGMLAAQAGNVSRSGLYSILSRKSCTPRLAARLAAALGLEMETMSRLVAGKTVEVRRT
jgi:hypothetical protein